MECVNCQFRNIPGSRVCGRCGTTLRFEDLDVPVEPPRAPRHGRWLRNRGLVWWNRTRQAAGGARAAVRGEARAFLDGPPPPAAFWLRMLVPGWPLRATGAPVLGWVVTAGWLVLVLLSLLFLGTHEGGILIGLAFGLHYAGGLTAARRGGYRGLRIFRFGALLALFLVVVLYLPVPWLFNRVVQPVTLDRDAGPFRDGDVVLYFPWSASERGGARAGQWVVFDVNYRMNTGGMRGQYDYAIVQPGAYLTQVLARPGDRLAWDGRRLTVNGEPALWQPAELPRSLAKPKESTVPGNRYFVAPWLPPEIAAGPPPNPAPNAPAGPAAFALDDPFLYIDTSQVRGRVFLRLHPLRDLGRVR